MKMLNLEKLNHEYFNYELPIHPIKKLNNHFESRILVKHNQFNFPSINHPYPPFLHP